MLFLARRATEVRREEIALFRLRATWANSKVIDITPHVRRRHNPDQFCLELD